VDCDPASAETQESQGKQPLAKQHQAPKGISKQTEITLGARFLSAP